MLAIHFDQTPEAREVLERLANRGEADFSRVEAVVREILDAVKKEGDVAVRRYAARFETSAQRGDASRPMMLHDFGGAAALARLAPADRGALELAAARIREFHVRARAREVDFHYETEGVAL
ncbi:MAG: Histidinol dehydrogenase, partial [Myxococcaceae bacterium]|nr:Histidinol dehydrogenase [Myxococcaceae bacterium]